jgi:hypothetical protein
MAEWEKVKADIAATYNVPVAAVLPLSEDVASNASNNIFSALYPDHPWSKGVMEVVNDLISS